MSIGSSASTKSNAGEQGQDGVGNVGRPGEGVGVGSIRVGAGVGGSSLFSVSPDDTFFSWNTGEHQQHLHQHGHPASHPHPRPQYHHLQPLQHHQEVSESHYQDLSSLSASRERGVQDHVYGLQGQNDQEHLHEHAHEHQLEVDPELEILDDKRLDEDEDDGPDASPEIYEEPDQDEDGYIDTSQESQRLVAGTNGPVAFNEDQYGVKSVSNINGNEDGRKRKRVERERDETTGRLKNRVGGGRPRDFVWSYFQEVRISDSKRTASCKTCSWKCEQPKAFRMRAHALTCANLDPTEKEKILRVQAEKVKEGGEGATTAKDGSRKKQKFKTKKMGMEEQQDTKSDSEQEGVAAQAGADKLSRENNDFRSDPYRQPSSISKSNSTSTSTEIPSGSTIYSQSTQLIHPQRNLLDQTIPYAFQQQQQQSSSSAGRLSHQAAFDQLQASQARIHSGKEGTSRSQEENPLQLQHHSNKHSWSPRSYLAMASGQQQSPLNNHQQSQEHYHSQHQHQQQQYQEQPAAKLARSPITCHVLDSSAGKPGGNIKIRMDQLGQTGFSHVASGETDADGRNGSLLLAGTQIEKNAIFKLTFYTREYFSMKNIESFYPFVEVVFEIRDPAEHHHIALLLSPFAYTTYRGS